MASCLDFICKIDTESYSIDFTCENSQVTANMNDEEPISYDTTGQTGLKVTLDQSQTYAGNNHTYKVTGEIDIDIRQNTVRYNISATGGEIGDIPQTCIN